MALTDGTVGQRAYLREPEIRWAKLSLGVSLLLLGIKLAAFFLTGSQAIFSDALENMANVVTAGFAVYAIQVAHRPADAEHPYGHGKIEFFSAGLEGSMIILASALIAGKVILSWVHGQGPDVHHLDIGLLLIIGALIGNGLLGWFLWISGRRNKALVLEAGGIHLLTDALDSVVVLVAIAIVRLTGWQWVDSAAALAVAAYIAFLGLGLLKRSANGLMDRQDPRQSEQLREILQSHVGPNGREPRICSFHKLRYRSSGRNQWVDFHIMVPATWNIERGHHIASAIEHEIEQTLGDANATGHVEPCQDATCPSCHAIQPAVTQLPQAAR